MAAKRIGKVSATRGANAPVVSYERKSELLGLFLMAIAFAVLLALASYNPVDNNLVRSYSFWEAFRLENNRAENMLGLVGANIAYFLIPSFLGLPIMVWPIIMFAWGYLFLRNRHSLYLPMYTTFGVLASFELSCFFGWFGSSFDFDTSLLSGNVGLAMADGLSRALGAVGSFFFICIMMLITGMLMIDRDLQRSMDRVEDIILSFWDLLKGWFGIIRQEVSGNRKDRLHKLNEERERLRHEEGLENALEHGRTGGTAFPPGQPPPPTRPQASLSGTVDTGDADGFGPFAQGGSDKRLHDLLRQKQHPVASAPPPPPGTAAPEPKEEPARPVSRMVSSLNPNVIEEVIKQPNAIPGSVQMKVQGPVQEEKTTRVTESAANVQLRDVRYRYPSIELLDASDDQVAIDYAELEENKQILLDKLATYNIEITDINAIVGPTITMYELTPAPGIKISRIKSLEDDLAMAMAARGIRIVAPIPGKSAIGVEIPNRHRELVRLRDLIATKKFRDNKMRLPFPLGKTIEGHVFIQDIASMPHLLIAGATGAGKSVCLNALITGLVYACHPSNVKFVMIDPKKIELQQYGHIVDHYGALPENFELPIITDVAHALGVLRSCEREMEFRYTLLQKAMVRGLHEYNLKFRNGDLPPEQGHRHLPYIIVVVDELADLMLTAGKEIEGPIARLAQMSRAVGIHLVLATQRPSVDVITGLIKANFPSRIAFQVASKIDSRTILDQNGAEGLVGNGDMLYMKGSQVIRLQCPYVSVDEVDCITEFIAQQDGPGPYFLPSVDDTIEMTVGGQADDDIDELFEEAARIIVQSQQGSVSLLQRKLSIGYTRSARIVDQLERAGIVGPFEGSKARQVLVQNEAELDQILHP